MQKYKTDIIFKEVSSELSRGFITPELLYDFCSNHNYSFCILRVDQDGLYYYDGNNLLVLDFLGQYVKGDGCFAKYENIDDDEIMYDELNEYLNKIEERDYDIMFVNDNAISLRVKYGYQDC